MSEAEHDSPRKSERILSRIDRLIDSLPCLVYRCRIEDGCQFVLEYASRGSEELLGISAENLVEKGINIIERMVVPADFDRLRKIECDSIVTHSPFQTMYRLNLPGNVVKWVWDQGWPVLDEESGRAVYLEGIMMDVSEQKFLELGLQEENRKLRMSVEHSSSLGDMVGKSDAMHHVYSLVLKAAETDMNVIIYGETGCGKDLVARAIHNLGGRRGAYVPVNCGALPENLLESEFFGYCRGAFTGASTSKEGFVAAADNGTLFLDEIGELPLHLQVKFLRVLETKTYTPLGSNAPRKSSFRLIAATNRDLAALVQEKTMRADFYYRINVLAITLPPLRERTEDIPLLINCWCERHDIELTIPRDIRLAMAHYPWPGNVRELFNFLDRYATFGKHAAAFLEASRPVLPDPAAEQTQMSLNRAVELFEKRMILASLEKNHWHRGRTADALGLNLRTLQRKIKSLGIREFADEDVS